MELPNPTQAKPESGYPVIIPDADSDWNKKNSRRNPDRAMVYKGQPNYKVLSNIHQICTKPEGVKESMKNFRGNDFGFNEAYYRPLQIITEWVELDGLYIVNMTMDGTVNWGGYNGSPVRVYNRLPTEDEVVWHSNRGYWNRAKVEDAWHRRSNNATQIPEPSVVAELMAFAETRKDELGDERHQQTVDQQTKDAFSRARSLNAGTHLREVAEETGNAELIEHIERTTTSAASWEYGADRAHRWQHASDESRQALDEAIERSRIAFKLDEEE